ncbi:MAG: hypothetical protein QOI01_393 [Mycobacterium sp.]|jgi:hypothetical protein|nr:hypothetical protein [Mycobacterium sp.]
MPALDYTPESNIAPVRSRCLKQLRPLPASAWANWLNRLHGNGLHRRWWQFRSPSYRHRHPGVHQGFALPGCAQSVCGKAPNQCLANLNRTSAANAGPVRAASSRPISPTPPERSGHGHGSGQNRTVHANQLGPGLLPHACRSPNFFGKEQGHGISPATGLQLPTPLWTPWWGQRDGTRWTGKPGARRD